MEVDASHSPTPSTEPEDASAEPKKRGRKRGVDQLDHVDEAELIGGRSAKRKAAAQVAASLPEAKPSRPVLALSLGEGTPADIKGVGLQIWEDVRDFEHEGRLLSPIFMELPSRELYPDYYDMIKKPISMAEIKEKLDKEEYGTLEAVKEDFNQMFTNAKKYNQEGSVVYEDARRLHKLIRSHFIQALGGGAGADDVDEDGKPAKKRKKAPSMKSWLLKKLEDTTFYQDSTGRYLSEIFMALPDRELYPDYYELIPHPMSFDIVTDKIKRRQYPAVKDFVADVNGIFANAKYYNQERSQVWLDAAQLERIFADHMKEAPPDFGGKGEKAEPEEAAKPKITLKLKEKERAPPREKPSLPPPPPPKIVPKQEEEEAALSSNALADITTLQVPAAAAEAPVARKAPTPQPVLPTAGPRIYREREVAQLEGKPLLSSVTLRCKPTGSIVELPMDHIRQHTIVLPHAVDIVDVIPHGPAAVRVSPRPLAPVNGSQEGSQNIFVVRPNPAQPLTTLDIYAKPANGAKEEIYRVFMQRLPV